MLTANEMLEIKINALRSRAKKLKTELPDRFKTTQRNNLYLNQLKVWVEQEEQKELAMKTLNRTK